MNSLRTIARSAFVAGCALMAHGLALAGEGASDIGSYRWTNVRPTVPFDPTTWSPRAGLQALELRNDLYVMGGRGPFSFETETVLHGDVWKSTDLGATWRKVAQWQPGQVAPGMWAPRAYFGAVTHRGRMFVIGGQNFQTQPNPISPDGCAFLPPGVPCLPFLPDSLHAFALTQRGHGDASRPAEGYRPRDFAADLAAFMDALHLGAAVIVGGSSGGFVARRFAIDHPERTLGLVLLGSPASLRDKPGVLQMWDSTVSKLTDPVDPAFARGFAESTLAQRVPRAFVDTMVRENLKVPARVWRATFEGLLEDDSLGELDRIKAPTLIVWGDRDAILPRADQETLEAAIPVRATAGATVGRISVPNW